MLMLPSTKTAYPLRFFYNTTLGRKEMIEEIPYPSLRDNVPEMYQTPQVSGRQVAASQIENPPVTPKRRW